MPVIEITLKNGRWHVDGKTWEQMRGQQRNDLNSFFIISKPMGASLTDPVPFESTEIRDCLAHYYDYNEIAPLTKAIEALYGEMGEMKKELIEVIRLARASDNNFTANKIVRFLEKLNPFINLDFSHNEF
jgi:hypothetical protein